MKMKSGVMALPRNRGELTGSGGAASRDDVTEARRPALGAAAARRNRGTADGLNGVAKWTLGCVVVAVCIGIAVGVCC